MDKKNLRGSFAVPSIVPLTVASLISFSTVGMAGEQAKPERPNILVIMADDLGYSDIGAFGGEIATPNIDALAANGRILTNFHTAAICSPTRASLMSGVDHHLAGIGNMAEVVGLNIKIDKPFSAPWGKSNSYDFSNIPEGYRGHLSDRVVSMAELFRDGGYHTSMVGKWHLGYDVVTPKRKGMPWYVVRKESLPSNRGFDDTFVLVNGAGSHFAPPSPPTALDKVVYSENGRVFPAAKLPKDFFSTTAYTDKLIAFIDANRESEKPFFAFASYTAPHWPLQAPAADIALQKGRYDEGFDVIRDRRIDRMKELGLIPQSLTASSLIAASDKNKLWHQLSDEERAREARLMEVYAAMVANMDAHIGRLIDHLKEIGEYDNTLIMFMSDNGAEGAPPFVPPIPGTEMDNSLENIGHQGSVVAYGMRWAEVSAAPFRLFKGFTGAEGGTSSPLIVQLPHQDGALPNSNARMHVMDVLPTLLELAGIDKPGTEYKGRPVHPIEGVSWLSALQSPQAFEAVRDTDAVLADELMGNSYVVKGSWKLSLQPDFSLRPVMRQTVPHQLFNLDDDRVESHDLSAEHPDVVADLQQAYQSYVKRAQVLEHARASSGR